MQVTVARSDFHTISDQGTIVIVTGTAEEQWVTFAGDHRAMWAFLEAAVEDRQAIAEVEPWQVLGPVPGS